MYIFILVIIYFMIWRQNKWLKMEVKVTSFICSKLEEEYGGEPLHEAGSSGAS